MSIRNLTELISQSVIATVSAVLSFFGALFWAHRKAIQQAVAERVTATSTREARITELEQKVALLGQTVQPLSAAFQAILVKQLSHFHTPRIDLLLAKLGPPVELTPDEEVELCNELKQRVLDVDKEISAEERGAAAMLPYVVQRVRREAVQKVSTMDIVLVAVPRGYE